MLNEISGCAASRITYEVCIQIDLKNYLYYLFILFENALYAIAPLIIQEMLYNKKTPILKPR